MYAQNTGESVPFWIDTLCVPLDRHYRSLAIAGMRQCYKTADKVLVLDSLVAAAPVDSGPQEILMRLIASIWMTRLWTLQEVADHDLVELGIMLT